MDGEAPPSLDELAIPLQSLQIEPMRQEYVVSLLDLLNSKTIAVKGLERLTVHPRDKYDSILIDMHEEVQTWDEWEDVVEVCREKKIKLVVTGASEH